MFVISEGTYMTVTTITKRSVLNYKIYTVKRQTLLSTPHVASGAFMLIQHNKQLGHKMFDSVTIFLEAIPLCAFVSRLLLTKEAL